MLTRTSDGKKFTDLTDYLEKDAARQSRCKHSKVSAKSSITGEPYPAHIQARTALICDTCHLVLWISRTERVPASLLKGKRFNRRSS